MGQAAQNARRKTGAKKKGSKKQSTSGRRTKKTAKKASTRPPASLVREARQGRPGAAVTLTNLVGYQRAQRLIFGRR